MNRTSRLSRPKLTMAQKDAAYLEGLSKRSARYSEAELNAARSLVSKYHDEVYCYVNEILFDRDKSLPTEIALDNYAYLAAKLKGKKSSRLEEAEQIHLTYRFYPETACHLRTARPAVRRKAVVMTKLFIAVSNSTLPDWCMRFEDSLPTLEFERIALKHHGRVDELITMILEHPDAAPSTIEDLMTGELAVPLAGGAL